MSGVLVIDDQHIVRTGIIKMIQDLEQDFGKIYEASNGEDALKIAKAHMPDILLVDIKMPGIDGLQFIENLKNENLNAHIIIISAYDDFRFTKKAINYKVDDYVLKPVSKDELYEILTTAKRKIEKYKHEDVHSQKKEMQYDCILFYEFLTGNNVFINTNNLYAKIKLPTVNPKYRIAIFHFSKVETRRIIRFKEVADREFCMSHIPILSFYIDIYKKLIYVLNINDTHNCLLKNILKSISKQKSFIISCGLSETLEGISALKNLYRQADIALKESIFKKSDLCAFTNIQRHLKVLINIDKYKMILDALRCEKKDKADRLLDEIFLWIQKEGVCAYDTQAIMLDMVNYLHMHIVCTYPKIDIIEDARIGLKSSKSILGIKSVVKRFIDNIYNHIKEQNLMVDTNWIINYIINYIENNYEKDISLTYISNELSMNYSYVSSLFSQKTGVQFSKYLLKIRLEKAKDLLEKSNIKIYELGKKVGFYDSKHFNKTFKKYFGITPGQYKNKFHSRFPS